MTTRTPAPVNVPVIPTNTGPLDRAPAPVSPAVDPELPRTPLPVLRPAVVAPAPAPAPFSSSAAPQVVLPIEEQPVETNPAPEGDRNIVPDTPRYVTVLSNGTVVVSEAAQLNFSGNGVSVTAQGSTANIVITAGGSGSSYTNANVVSLLAAFGSNTITTTGNVTAGYFIGNGSQLTGLPPSYSNANVATLLSNFGSNTITTTGNITGGNIRTTGIVSATGNVTGSFFIGNGSQLTGITTTYSNANVAAYLPTYTGNLVSLTGDVITTGNITGNYFVGNGSQLTGISASTGDITFDGANISAPDDTVIRIQAKDDDSVVRSYFRLDPDNGYAEMRALSSQRTTGFTSSDWATGEWTGTENNAQLAFTGATNILDFLNGAFGGSTNQTISVNGSEPMVYNGWSGGGDDVTFFVDMAPPADPTTITSIDFSYYYSSRIEIDYDDDEINIRGNDLDVNIDSTERIDIRATNSVEIQSDTVISLLNDSATDPIIIRTSNGNTNQTWEFGASGNLTIPGNVTSAGTIRLDNRASGNTADINLFSADDITVQACDRTLGSGSEGGDINILAGDSAEDGNTTGGDVIIEAGNGGAANVGFGGSGGFIRIQTGRGGDASTQVDGENASNGGELTLRAGDAGSNNGNIDRGATGGDVRIESGDSTGNLIAGGDIVLSTGIGGANAGAGAVVIDIPSSDQGPGGEWVFGSTGNSLSVPQNAEIFGFSAGNITVGTWGNAIVRTIGDGPTTYDWTFDPNGKLTAPGSVEIGTGDTGVQLSSNQTGNGFYADIVNITNGLSTVVVTLADVEFGESDQGTVRITGVEGETEANGFWGWLAVDVDQIQLYTDSTLSTPVDGTTWSAYSDGGLAVSSGHNNLDIQGGSVAIISGAGKYWSFDPAGNLTLPQGGTIGEGPSPSFLGDAVTITPANGSDADQQLKIYPTFAEGNHLHLTTGNLYNTELYVGDDNLYVKLSNTGNVVINSNDNLGNTAQWTFGANSVLTLPGEGTLQSIDDSVTLRSINTTTGNANGVYVGTAGGLGFFDQSVSGNWLEIFRNNTDPQIGTTGNLLITTDNTNTAPTWTFGADGDLTAPGNITATNLPTKFTGSWSVPTGNSTQSFTVDGNNTYQMWVEGNIPNGIIAWNALVTVTNTNVPVLGQQFAWNYEGGGNVLMFNTIPAQIIGTAGAISNVEPAVSNTNVFSFGINNASGNTITVDYGWVKLS